MAVTGLVLAAGAGRRFGGPKAVAMVAGERLVDRAVRVLRDGGCARVVVVLGAAVTEVPGADVVVHEGWAEGLGSSLRAGLDALEDAEKNTEKNTDEGTDTGTDTGDGAAAGTAGTDGPTADRRDAPPADRTDTAPAAGTDTPTAAGTDTAATASTDAALVVLVDGVRLAPAAVRRVLDAGSGPGALAAATYGGRRRHPVLLGRDHWPGVRALAVGETGARPYLLARGSQVTEVDCTDLGDPGDLDTPADLSDPTDRHH